MHYLSQTFSLIRCHYTEYRSLWVAPLAWLAILSSLAVISLLGLGSDQIDFTFEITRDSEGELQKAGGIHLLYPFLFSTTLGITIWLCASFLTGKVTADRDSKAILFWNSLPLSSTLWVLSLYLTALLTFLWSSFWALFTFRAFESYAYITQGVESTSLLTIWLNFPAEVLLWTGNIAFFWLPWLSIFLFVGSLQLRAANVLSMMFILAIIVTEFIIDDLNFLQLFRYFATAVQTLIAEPGAAFNSENKVGLRTFWTSVVVGYAWTLVIFAYAVYKRRRLSN